MNYSFINNTNLNINNTNLNINNTNLNIDYSNFIKKNDNKLNNMPSFLLFNNDNQSKYFEKYSVINKTNISNEKYNKFRAIFFSLQNTNNINQNLKNMIKQKKNVSIKDISTNTIKKYLGKIFMDNYNIINDINIELDRLNKIVLDDLFKKSISALDFHNIYIKDITNVNHRYSNYTLPLNTNNKGTKYVNPCKRFINLCD
tara:strand:+ start:6700 stop:7302 length:603 start_codon:yes stop_codon:yes gene_type:complete